MEDHWFMEGDIYNELEEEPGQEKKIDSTMRSEKKNHERLIQQDPKSCTSEEELLKFQENDTGLSQKIYGTSLDIMRNNDNRESSTANSKFQTLGSKDGINTKPLLAVDRSIQFTGYKTKYQDYERIISILDDIKLIKSRMCCDSKGAAQYTTGKF